MFKWCHTNNTPPPTPPPNRKNSMCKYLIFSILHFTQYAMFYILSLLRVCSLQQCRVLAYTKIITRPKRNRERASKQDQPSKHKVCIKFFWIYQDAATTVAAAAVKFGCLKRTKSLFWLFWCVWVYARGLSDFIVMGIKGGAKVICLMQ